MDILISLIGAIIFYSLMIYLYRYSSGKHKVKDPLKKEKYAIWVETQGKSIKKGLVVLMVIFGIFFLVQILTDLSKLL